MTRKTYEDTLNYNRTYNHTFVQGLKKRDFQDGTLLEILGPFYRDYRQREREKVQGVRVVDGERDQKIQERNSTNKPDNEHKEYFLSDDVYQRLNGTTLNY